MSNTALTPPAPAAPAQPFGGVASLRKFTVDEYHRMIEAGILVEGEPVELLEGYLVLKVSEGQEYDDTLPFGGMANMRRFTIDEYHELIRTGILTKNDPVELLEGHVVLTMPRSPAHDFAILALNKRFTRMAPDEYTVSCQCATTIQSSEPEPDLAVIRGDERLYRTKHPGPENTALVVEVSGSSLARDRGGKARIYARGGIPVYWVVNVEGRVIEVNTLPSGPAGAAGYTHCEDYPVGTSVPVVLDGATVGAIAVADVMA